MQRSTAYICIFVILSFSVTLSTASAVEMSSKRDCAICHIMWIDDFRTDKKTLIKWQPGNVLMKDTQGVVSSEEICYSCHDGYVVDSRHVVWNYNRHPTFIKPSSNVTVPFVLPLSNKDEIYCGTCHSAHGVGADTDGSRSKATSFFRIKNVDSKLCNMCHGNEANYRRSNGHPLNTTAIKIPETLFALGGVKAEDKNKVICQTCHKVHGAKGNKIAIIDNKNSKLCVMCHDYQKHIIGTKHDLKLSLPDVKNIKKQKAAESGPCGACHIPHNAGKKRLWARQTEPGDPGSWMCMVCHGKKSGYRIKHIGKYSHPNNVYLDAKAENKLPLFSGDLKKNSAGKVQCFTCHEVHRWNPAPGSYKINYNIEGDASNSFLRISNSQSSKLCLNCHADKQQLITSDHNLTVTAPNEKNSQGFSPSVSGPCGSCHIPHNAVNKKLWAKKLVGDKDMVTQFCTACHSKNGAAKTKLIGDHYHPVDVEFKELKLKEGGKDISAMLPFFNSSGDRMSDAKHGKVVCITCHEPHLWNPKDSGPVLNYAFKNMEGDTTNSFLRKPNFPSSDLCKTCHADKALVDGTDHDLNVTAPNATNLLGQTVRKSGQCGVCHLVHNSPNTLKLWARPYGDYSLKNESPMNALCTSCHSKRNTLKIKSPAIAYHPPGKLINNIMGFNRKSGNFTPLFNKEGKEVNFGDISCPSCHNPHQWNFKSNLKNRKSEKGIGRFLRTKSYNTVCKDCHGQDALYRYQYFHVPEKRKKQTKTKNVKRASQKLK